MSEIVIVSARKPRLQALENAGRRGARTALDLASDPGKFLSTVQIGITLIGILAGAYSGSSPGQPVADRLTLLGLPPDSAQTIGFALVIGLVTYARSEEHTSELQSLMRISYAVFCLKKKNITIYRDMLDIRNTTE